MIAPSALLVVLGAMTVAAVVLVLFVRVVFLDGFAEGDLTATD